MKLKLSKLSEFHSTCSNFSQLSLSLLKSRPTTRNSEETECRARSPQAQVPTCSQRWNSRSDASRQGTQLKAPFSRGERVSACGGDLFDSSLYSCGCHLCAALRCVINTPATLRVKPRECVTCITSRVPDPGAALQNERGPWILYMF